MRPKTLAEDFLRPAAVPLQRINTAGESCAHWFSRVCCKVPRPETVAIALILLQQTSFYPRKMQFLDGSRQITKCRRSTRRAHTSDVAAVSRGSIRDFPERSAVLLGRLDGQLKLQKEMPAWTQEQLY